MFLTLLKYQFRISINSLIRAPKSRQVGWAIASCFVIVYYYQLTLAMLQIYGAYEEKMLTGFVKGNFGIVFLLALMNVSSATFYKIFRRNDLPILLSLPISKATMFKVKLLETFKDSLKSLAFPLPLYTAFMITIKASTLEWVILALGWMIIALSISSFGVITSILLANYFSEFGAKFIARTIALAVAIALVVMFIGYGRMADSGNIETLEPLKEFKPYISSRVLGIFPTSWIVDSVNSIHHWRIGSFIFSLFKISAFLAVCVLTSSRIYVLKFDKSWALISERKSRKPAKIRGKSTLNLGLNRGVFGGILVKEIKVIWRESYIWLNLMAPLTMVGVMLLLENQFLGSSTSRGKYLIQASIVSITVSITHSFSSVGREGKMFSLIRTLPINSAILLWAKALVGAIPNLIFTESYLLISDFMNLKESLFFGVMISSYFSLLGVSSGALFPRFDFSNPAKAGAIGGSAIMYFLSSAFIGSIVAIEEVGLGVTTLIFCLIIWLAFALVMSLIAAKSLQNRDVLV